MAWEISSAIVLPIFLLITVVGIFGILKFTKNKTKNVSNLRLFIQIIALIAIFMGLVLGPFDVARWAPLGPSPRDRLLGAGFLDNQFPDGISVPVLACYYANGRTVTCPIWQIQAYIFPFWNFSRGYAVSYSTSGLEMLAIVIGLVILLRHPLHPLNHPIRHIHPRHRVLHVFRHPHRFKRRHPRQDRTPLM